MTAFSIIVVSFIVIGGTTILCILSYVMGFLKGHNKARWKYEKRITELNQKVYDLIDHSNTITINPNQTKMKI
jgi:hypothetical protein